MNNQKAKCLTDDPLGRFKKGEIGDVLNHDSKKYDYLLDFGDISVDSLSDESRDLCLLRGIRKIARHHYFYEHEIELLGEKDEQYTSTSGQLHNSN